MPTYEYECQRCGHHFDVFQSMSDEPKKRCPKCRGKVKRVIGTGAGIIFKGPGFYATDYRSDSYKKDAAVAGKSETVKKSSGDTKKKTSPATSKAKKAS